MNRTAIVRIQAALLGFCLTARGLAAPALRDGAATGGQVPPALAASDLEPVPEQEAATSGTDGQSRPDRPQAPADPPNARSGSSPEEAANQVPSAAPLPAESSPEGPSGSRAAQAGSRPANQPQGSPRAPVNRPQEIEFDDQGLITLHTNELDVRQLLELISRRSGMNILLSPRVQGNITANFEKIPAEDLVRSVLKLSNLVEKVEGNVHYIYTREDLKDQSENKKKERILTKVYRLNYVRADELMVMIAPFLSPDVGRKRFSTSANYLYGISEASTLTTGGMTATPIAASAAGAAATGAGAALGNAGTIQRGTQPPTGGLSMSSNDMVVIQDYESNLKIIDQIIRRIDIRPVQVLIEAVIISVELTRDKELGVNFALVDNLGQQLGTIGAGAAINGNVGFTPAQVLTAAGKLATSSPPDPTGFASATNGIKYGFVSNNVTGFIRAVESLGSTKILASPRLLVLNKQRAEIQLGARLGFRTLSQNYTSTIQQVQFLNVGTLLRIRPFVSTDGMVRMEIHPERSSGVVQDDLPSARTAELTTNVMVPDGATLVIGGLMEDEDTYQQTGLPGLSRVPLLGHAFGLKRKTDTRRELVVLLTPHIWTENDPQDGHAAELAMRDRPRPVHGPSRPPAHEPAAGESTSTAPAGRRTSHEDEPSPRAAGSSPSDAALGEPRTASSPPVSALLEVDPDLAVGASDEGEEEASARGLPPAPLETTPRPVTPSTAPSAPQRTPGLKESTPLPVRRASLQVEIQPVVHHRVAEGETLQSIAQRHYGSGRFAPALWEANRGVLARSKGLEPGIDLNIPPPNELDPGILQLVRAAPKNTGASEIPTASPQRNPKPRGLVEPPVKRSARASDELTDTLESQPDTPVGDVIDSRPWSPDDSSFQDRPRLDPMLARAVREQPPDQPGPGAGVLPKWGGAAAESGEGGFAVHIVRTRETMRSIARDRLGDPRRAGEIVEWNRELLGEDLQPRPGMRLVLPPRRAGQTAP